MILYAPPFLLKSSFARFSQIDGFLWVLRSLALICLFGFNPPLAAADRSENHQEIDKAIKSLVSPDLGERLRSARFLLAAPLFFERICINL